MAVGTTFTDHGRMGTFAGEVVEFAPAARVVYQERLRWFGRQVLDARISYEFRATPGGTAIHHVAESELHGVFRLDAADGEADRPGRAPQDAGRPQAIAGGGAGAGAEAAA